MDTKNSNKWVSPTYTENNIIKLAIIFKRIYRSTIIKFTTNNKFNKLINNTMKYKYATYKLTFVHCNKFYLGRTTGISKLD